MLNDKNIKRNLQKILFHYKLLPHQECGKSPAELMFGRNLNSRLNLIFPRAERKNEDNNKSSTKIKQFEIGERVAVREYLDKTIKWRFGIIIEKLGRLHYRIQLPNRKIWKRHINQMRTVRQFSIILKYKRGIMVIRLLIRMRIKRNYVNHRPRYQKKRDH